MFRLEGVCDSIKSPLAPLFEKGGDVYTPALLIVVIGVLILFQAFISAPFENFPCPISSSLDTGARIHIVITPTLTLPLIPSRQGRGN